MIKHGTKFICYHAEPQWIPRQGSFNIRFQKIYYFLTKDCSESTTRSIYGSIILSKHKCATSRHYFFERLNVPEDDKTWKKIYLLPSRATMDTKTRIFQYKIPESILFLDERLFCMKVVPSTYCSLCSDFTETVAHLFCDCKVAKRFVEKHIAVVPMSS